MDPLVEQLLATTGLSCDDLLVKLQQYRSQKTESPQEENTASDSTKQTNEDIEQCTTSSDKSVIFETISSAVASNETSDIKINPQTKLEHKDEGPSTEIKPESNKVDCNIETKRDSEDGCSIRNRFHINNEDGSATLTSVEKIQNTKSIEEQSDREDHIDDSCPAEKANQNEEHGSIEDGSATITSEEENPDTSSSIEEQTLREPHIDDSCTSLTAERGNQNEEHVNNEDGSATLASEEESQNTNNSIEEEEESVREPHIDDSCTSLTAEKGNQNEEHVNNEDCSATLTSEEENQDINNSIEEEEESVREPHIYDSCTSLAAEKVNQNEEHGTSEDGSATLPSEEKIQDTNNSIEEQRRREPHIDESCTSFTAKKVNQNEEHCNNEDGSASSTLEEENQHTNNSIEEQVREPHIDVNSTSLTAEEVNQNEKDSNNEQGCAILTSIEKIQGRSQDTSNSIEEQRVRETHIDDNCTSLTAKEVNQNEEHDRNEEGSAAFTAEEKIQDTNKSIEEQSVGESHIDDGGTSLSSEEVNENEGVKVKSSIITATIIQTSKEEIFPNNGDLPSCSHAVVSTADKESVETLLAHEIGHEKIEIISCEQTQKEELVTKDNTNSSTRDEETNPEICNNITADSNGVKILLKASEGTDASDHDYSSLIDNTNNQKTSKLPSDENLKTPKSPAFDSERETSPVDQKNNIFPSDENLKTPKSPAFDSKRETSPPKAEGNLRDILRMQLSSLRNMKKSTNYMTDLKKTSVSFQDLKKKRKSCEISPFTIDGAGGTENEAETEKPETKTTMFSSNENSIVSLSEETDFLIVNVTGGVDQLAPNSELGNEEKREFETVSNTNEDNILNNDKVEDTQESMLPAVTDNEKPENQESDVNVPGTSNGIVSGMRVYKKKLFSRYDPVSKGNAESKYDPVSKENAEALPSISVKKNISETFTHDPGVSESTKNCEKSPFISDSLDDFLNESAQLRVSYPIPKLGAEEGISENRKPSPFDDIVSKAPKVEQQSVPKEPKLVKAKTLAEMRRHFEKLKRTDMKAEKQPFETLSRYKQKKLLQQQELLQQQAAASPKNSFIMYDNKKLRVYSKNKQDKCVAVLHSKISKLNKENIQERPMTPPPHKQGPEPTRRLSLLSCMLHAKPAAVRYKPGPLCKKVDLQSLESKDRWAAELKVLPKIYMEVVPQIGQPIDPKLVHLLPIFDEPVISEERANFALSVLKPKNTSTPESFTFHIPYMNRQEKFLVRRKCKPVIRVEDTNKKEETDPETEIKNVINDIVTYVEIKEIGDSVIKEDDLIVEPAEKPIEIWPKSRGPKVKRKKLDMELKRLSCKVIDVATRQSEVLNCTKPYCRMGCVCKSLLCESIFSNHCQLVSCMFGCKCLPTNSTDVTTSHNSLSVHTVNHLEDKAKKNLAKVEREFTQTYIHTDNDAILVGTAKMRRSSKPPKKYTDYIDGDVIFDDVPLNILDLKPKKFDLVLPNLDLDDLIPYCLFHNMYDCHCKGAAVDFPTVKREAKIKEVPQIPKIRIVKTKEDQHKAWYDSCARIRKVFPEYKERNKNPVYNQKLRKALSTQEKIFFKRRMLSSEQNDENETGHENSDEPSATKPNKRKQSFVIREDVSPIKHPFTGKPDKEFALQRRKKKFKPKLNYTSLINSSTSSLSFDSSISSTIPEVSVSNSTVDAVALPTFKPVFEGEIKLCVKDNQEMLNIMGNGKEYLRILPWEKLIENYKAGKIGIWVKDKGPATVICNSSGWLPPRNFTEIKNTRQRNDLIEWILTDNVPGVSRELLHLILTPKSDYFMIPGYCLKKPDGTISTGGKQPKQRSLLINRTTQNETTESLYDFTKPKGTKKTIQSVDPEKLQSTLDQLSSQNVSLLAHHRKPSKRSQIVKRHPNSPMSHDATPTIQQVLNSHKLELSRTSLKRKSLTSITKEAEDKRIRCETPSFSKTPVGASASTKTAGDVGLELLELLDSSSQKRKDNIFDSDGETLMRMTRDPLDITEMEILLDESNKKDVELSHVPEDKAETVARDPLDISEPVSPEDTSSQWSLNARDPLVRPKQIVKDNSSDVLGTKEDESRNCQRDPLEITAIDNVTPEKQPSLLKTNLTEGCKKTTAKNRQTPQPCLIPSRSLKCTHKDMNNTSKTLVLTNKVFLKRKVICNSDKTPEITIPLPPVARHLRWRMIYLNSDFTFLRFVKANYSIKYTDLMDVVKMSGNIKSTITLRNKEFSDHYKHPLFGIFCAPDYQDRLFVGPYLPMETHQIETLRYLQGRLIDTESFNKMVGRTTSDKSPMWLYETPAKRVTVSNDVIDITEDDEADDIPTVNLDSDSSEETQNGRLKSCENNLLCPPFVEEITGEELSVHNINRYIVTNIPHLGYFYACQRESKSIDVFWPGTNKGYRFPNVTFAKNLLTQYLTQVFCSIPQDFKINVIIMTNVGIQGNKPIDPKYFSSSGTYFCGEFGIYEKDTLPEELLTEYNVPSVDRLLKLHQEVQEEDESLIRLFGLFLMSNEELRKHGDPQSILQWAISEIYVLQKLCGNYQSEKTDLQNIIREKSEQIKRTRRKATPDDSMRQPKRVRIEDAPESSARVNVAETIEIRDSDDEDTAETSSPVFKKISSSGKVTTPEMVYVNDEGRSVLKSTLWIQKGRSVLKTSSKTGEIIKGSPEKSPVVHPVKISINNSNIILNKNKMLITKLK